jgi:hypothetical protein
MYCSYIKKNLLLCLCQRKKTRKNGHGFQKVKSKPMCGPSSLEKQHSLRAGKHETKHPINEMTGRQIWRPLIRVSTYNKNNRLRVNFPLVNWWTRTMSNHAFAACGPNQFNLFVPSNRPTSKCYQNLNIWSRLSHWFHRPKFTFSLVVCERCDISHMWLENVSVGFASLSLFFNRNMHGFRSWNVSFYCCNIICSMKVFITEHFAA